MYSPNMKQLIELSKKHKGPIADAVVKATEVGVVVPSILRKHLEEAGLKIVDDPEAHQKDGYRELSNLCRVHIHGHSSLHPECEKGCEIDDLLIAAATAPDKPEALLHACLGFLRECEIKAAKNKGEKPEEYGLGTVAVKPLV